jgi:hypothetical protein
LLLIFLLSTFIIIMDTVSVLAEVIDVVVLVQEGEADLADGEIAGKADVVVLLVGSGQAVA